MIGIDTLLALDERALWIAGWTADEEGPPAGLRAISTEGHEVELDDAFRLRRPDLGEGYGGFIKYAQLSAPSRPETRWMVRSRGADGAAVEVDAPPSVNELGAARDVLLDVFGQPRGDLEKLRREHLHPALSHLQERHRKSVEIESVVEYGVAPASPAASVVVTLYRRIDFFRHQMLQFARDAALRDADLVYVLDSPELADSLYELASRVHDLHGVPFRIVRLTRNAGFPLANNLGASVARGRILLLLNSDVLPDLPGWLEKMVGFYDATPQIGALGPKLLYEDEATIQHAGMYFEREAPSGQWENLHAFKGLHRRFEPANISRPVPAVTGACLMIDRALYEEVGGLNSGYVQIGYEDSDICLRLAQRGRRSWYVAEAELFHLEGQAHPTAARVASTKYNRWLQTDLWDSLIEDIMGDEEPPAAPRAAAGSKSLQKRSAAA